MKAKTIKRPIKNVSFFLTASIDPANPFAICQIRQFSPNFTSKKKIDLPFLKEF